MANESPNKWEPPEHPARKWAPIQLGDWVTKTGDEKQWLVEYREPGSKEPPIGFLPRDSKMLVSGKPKVAMKSYFASAISLIVASGKPVGPFIPVSGEPVPTLVLAAEGAKAGTRDRWNFLSNYMNIDLSTIPLHYDHRTAITLEDNEWWMALRKFIVDKEIGFIVLDPLVMYMKGDENQVNEVAAVMKRLGELAKTDRGTTIMFVHHLNKGFREQVPDVAF